MACLGVAQHGERPSKKGPGTGVSEKGASAVVDCQGKVERYLASPHFVGIQAAPAVGIEMQQRSVSSMELQKLLLGGCHLVIALVDKSTLEQGLALWTDAFLGGEIEDGYKGMSLVARVCRAQVPGGWKLPTQCVWGILTAFSGNGSYKHSSHADRETLLLNITAVSKKAQHAHLASGELH